MELYHIHLMGNNDRLYKEGNEFYVNPKYFNNGIYNKVMDTKFSVPKGKYSEIVELMNFWYKFCGEEPCGETPNIRDVIDFKFRGNDYTNLKEMLIETRNMISKSSQSNRELAIEEYRRNYASDKPSRLHSLFACDEYSLGYWKKKLCLRNFEIYKIDVFDEAFKTNEKLLPNDSESYFNIQQEAYKYFYPADRDLRKENDEVLVTGKIKLLKKIDESNRRIYG